MSEPNMYKFMSETFILPSADKDEVHKVRLSISDPVVIRIHEWYERACTAEYILTNKQYTSQCNGREDVAYKVADTVRNRMDKYGETETEALDAIFCNFQLGKYL